MSTEKLIQALHNVLRADTEETEARERYDGHDWGYHGLLWTNASRKADEAFQAALEDAIDARVRALLAEVELQRPSSGNENDEPHN